MNSKNKFHKINKKHYFKMNPPGVGGDISACTPYSARDQFSFDFIRCEQGGGFVGAHFALGVSTFVFFPDFYLAAFIVFLSELIEWSTYILILRPANLIIFTDDDDFETMAGSWVGDVLIQGASGLLVGYLYHRLWNYSPPLVPLRYFWRIRDDSYRRGARVTIDKENREKTVPTIEMIIATVSFFILYYLLAALHLWVGTDFNWGAIVFIAARLLFLAIYLAITSFSKTWSSAIWGRRFPLKRRIGFLLFLWLIESVVNVHNIGFLYIANNQWYQSWTWQGLEIVILFILNFIFMF